MKQNTEILRQIAELGSRMGPEIVGRTRQVFESEQSAIAAANPPIATDLAYGEHERHRLDLYGPADRLSPLPVLLFIHGGGFVMGDKGSADNWANANVGRMAASAGMIGAVMNYRLAPDNQWPAGSEDIEAALAWLKDNVAAYGGDPERMIAVGTSAGAIHLAGYIKRHPHDGAISGAVLLSALFGFTALEGRDGLYYGNDELYQDRRPLDGVLETSLPLFIASAEFDPPRFQKEFADILPAILKKKGRLPKAVVLTGHTHYSMAMHLGTSDTRLSDEISDFAEACFSKM